MDPIEVRLKDLAERMEDAWRMAQCVTCPLGELAALAAATLVFYQESQHTKSPREDGPL